MNDQYIPDMTERFPEGPRGIDMTDSYFEQSINNHESLEDREHAIEEMEDMQEINEVLTICFLSDTFEEADKDLEENYIWKGYRLFQKEQIFEKQHSDEIYGDIPF